MTEIMAMCTFCVNKSFLITAYFTLGSVRNHHYVPIFAEHIAYKNSHLAVLFLFTIIILFFTNSKYKT